VRSESRSWEWESIGLSTKPRLLKEL